MQVVVALKVANVPDLRRKTLFIITTVNSYKNYFLKAPNLHYRFSKHFCTCIMMMMNKWVMSEFC